MRVLDVTSFFASSAGGIRTYYEAKARWLPARGVECHFAVPGARADTSRFGGGWLHRIAGPALDASYRCFGDLPALWRLVRDVDPDVVELGSHYLLPQLLAPALWRRRRPAVVGFYHADFPSTYVGPAVGRLPAIVRRAAEDAAWWLVRRQHRGYARTLAGSWRIARALEARGVSRVRWVGLGVDAETFQPAAHAERPRRLGFLGRWSSDKELGIVLAAAPELRRCTGAAIAIAGAGPLGDAVARAEARGDVEVVGLLEGGPAAAAFLGSLDALIVPGRHESFGLAAAEALACATPVIGADRGGARELVTRSRAGLTFAAGSPEALVGAAELLYQLPASARTALGARGRAFILGGHTWDHVFARIHGVYQEVAC